MIIRILIISGGLLLILIGTYVIHWLLNAQEWVDIYIRKNRPDLLAKKKVGRRADVKRRLKKYEGVAKAVSYRDKVIEFLAKDKPQTAPIYIYILMSSALLLILFAIVALGYIWTQLD